MYMLWDRLRERGKWRCHDRLTENPPQNPMNSLRVLGVSSAAGGEHFRIVGQTQSPAKPAWNIPSKDMKGQFFLRASRPPLTAKMAWNIPCQ